MILPVITALFIGAGLSLALFPVGIRLAERYGILDLPSMRKRHKNPVPIVGGVCIFAAWTVSMAAFRALSDDWSPNDTTSLLVSSAAIWSLIALGLWDDVRGLSPRIKLVVQLSVAAFTVAYEPALHAICAQKAAGLSVPLAFALIYAPAVIWIVGVMNAINLIDGIDGFAGGTSLLISLSLLVMHLLPGGGSFFGTHSLLLLIAPLSVFLRHNWNPAKVFLGDNGSLSLGFLLALNALIHRSCSVATKHLIRSTPATATRILDSGDTGGTAPILDMGLCTYRRFRSGYPIFKADRSHLHHRIQRLGLTKSRTVALLLCLVAYSQITAIFLNSVHFQLVCVGIAGFALSMFVFLFLLRSMEEWAASGIVKIATVQSLDDVPSEEELRGRTVVSVNLSPLLEVGFHEEKTDVNLILSSLRMMIARSVRPGDKIYFLGTEMRIALVGASTSRRESALVLQRVRKKLAAFQELYSLHYSIVGLPVSISGEQGKIASTLITPHNGLQEASTQHVA